MGTTEPTDKLVENIRRRVWALICFWDYPLKHVEDQAEVSRGTLSRFIHGKRGEEPSMRWLLAIAEVLRADYGWLVSGKSPDPTKVYPQLELKPVPARLKIGRPEGQPTVKGGRSRRR